MDFNFEFGFFTYLADWLGFRGTGREDSTPNVTTNGPIGG